MMARGEPFALPCDEAQPVDIISAVDTLTSVVTGSSISAKYEIPEVPGGGMIDRTKVNASYSDDGAPQIIGYVVGGVTACGQQSGG